MFPSFLSLPVPERIEAEEGSQRTMRKTRGRGDLIFKKEYIKEILHYSFFVLLKKKGIKTFLNLDTN